MNNKRSPKDERMRYVVYNNVTIKLRGAPVCNCKGSYETV